MYPCWILITCLIIITGCSGSHHENPTYPPQIESVIINPDRTISLTVSDPDMDADTAYFLINTNFNIEQHVCQLGPVPSIRETWLIRTDSLYKYGPREIAVFVVDMAGNESDVVYFELAAGSRIS